MIAVGSRWRKRAHGRVLWRVTDLRGIWVYAAPESRPCGAYGWPQGTFLAIFSADDPALLAEQYRTQEEDTALAAVVVGKVD